MRKEVSILTFALVSLLFASLVAAQTSANPSVFLSSNEVTFFNGDQDSVDVTITNNDVEAHTFTVSVFPNSLDKVFADPSLNHVTLSARESVPIKVSFSSVFEAEFVPREFAITIAAIDDPSISATKEVVVTVLRRSPVFVLSMNTNKFSYAPDETINISSVVSNQGGDSFEEFTTQTSISRDGQFVKRFEGVISFLSEKSKTTFSNLYTLDQFAQPGVYSAQMVLKEANGQTLSIKSVNFKVVMVESASQQETSSVGILDTTTTITSTNEGNAPTSIRVVATVPAFARELFDSDIKPTSMEDFGSSIRVSWIFNNVGAGETVQVVYKLVVWKIWMTVVAIIVIVFLAFKFVFTVKISKWSRFLGPITKDTEVPVSIEIVNRSMHEVKGIVVRDFVPPIAKIVPRFETVKPSMRETIGGTEVSWKFDSLRAGEERIMTYRIKPKMDVIGSLRLNPASVTYSTRKREKKSAASGMVVVRE